MSKSNVALLVTTNGEVKRLEFTQENAYETFRDAMGVRILERVPVLKDVLCWLDEEGRLTDNPVANPTATYLYQQAYGPVGFIAGNVIFTGEDDEEGNVVGLDGTSYRIIDGLAQQLHNLTPTILTGDDALRAMGLEV